MLNSVLADWNWLGSMERWSNTQNQSKINRSLRVNGTSCINHQLIFQLLDSLDLNIHRVSEEATGKQLDFVVGDPEKYIGSKVEVTLPASNESLVDIRIEYTTSKDASGLVWLTKEQTAGKTHAYLFSVCEPYGCRSMVPLQVRNSLSHSLRSKMDC